MATLRGGGGDSPPRPPAPRGFCALPWGSLWEGPVWTDVCSGQGGAGRADSGTLTFVSCSYHIRASLLEAFVTTGPFLRI